MVLCSHIYDNLQQSDNSTTSMFVVFTTLALLSIEFDIDTVLLGQMQLAFAVQVE